MMSEAALQEHPLGRVPGKTTPDENIASLQKTLIDVHDVDDALLQLHPSELL